MYSSSGDLVSEIEIWSDVWSKVGEHNIFDPAFDTSRAIEFSLRLPDLLSDDSCDGPCRDILNVPVSYEKVASTVNKMSIKAGGLDNRCSEQLKFGGDVVHRMSFELISLVWDQLTDPEIWKRGIIFPLFKKGDIHQVDNYRGIVQCLSCKILDKVLSNRLKE